MLESHAWESTQWSAAYSWSMYAFGPVFSDSDQYAVSPITEIQTENLAQSTGAASEWVIPEREIKRILVESFKKVPQVRSICAQFGSDGIEIWTLLDSYNRDAREAVYKQELALCEALGACDFDFRVSSIDLVSPQELVAAGAREIFQRA